VAVAPVHIVFPGEDTSVNVGIGITVIVMAPNALHPALEPVTEYVVVKLGVTAKD
jgi:hypothetical protein